MKSLLSLKIVILALGYLHVAYGGSLVVKIIQPRTQPACCNDPNLLSCTQVGITASALGDSDLEITPLNQTLYFKGTINGNENAYHYESNTTDMVLSHNVATGGVFGHASVNNGDSYTIEHCGNGVHVFKQIDVKNLGENEGIDAEAGDQGNKRSVNVPSADTTTIVTYSIKFYYTPQVAAATPDIEGFAEQVIQETNQGYINSKVPVRVSLLCTEQATINDQNGSGVLSAFANMKGSSAALRGTADAAALIVLNFNYCGIGYLNTIGSGLTVSVTAKSCALGYYSFGHEIGHNFGLYHNKEITNNPTYPYGHGYLIGNGYRTIMAYRATGSETRVNVYSNPDVNVNGAVAGNAATANNARVLTEQRFNMAAIGDESQSCNPGTTTPAPEDCSTAGQYRGYYHQYIGRLSESSCKARCESSSTCKGWVRNNRYSWCYLLQVRFYTYSKSTSGVKLTSASCAINTGSCSNTNRILYIRYMGRASSSSAADCNSKCKASSSCVEWELYNGYCYMFRSYMAAVSSWSSAMKYCN